ncbi:hypothetical protein [Neorhizobium alkalisoli]|uniref:hypothetical protein n=1 Tax=Neorhizobium alkalisoli TaxID=528178 RepID=UPI0011A40E08|nr:hypothetical protein [Neorhizobium alkalisoli]
MKIAIPASNFNIPWVTRLGQHGWANYFRFLTLIPKLSSVPLSTDMIGFLNLGQAAETLRSIMREWAALCVDLSLQSQRAGSARALIPKNWIVFNWSFPR